jgi:hypothetical protein
MKKKLFYIDTDYGCGLRAAKDIKQAHKEELAASGTNHFKSIREATKEDVEWVSGMGGHVPNVKSN